MMVHYPMINDCAEWHGYFSNCLFNAYFKMRKWQQVFSPLSSQVFSFSQVKCNNDLSTRTRGKLLEWLHYEHFATPALVVPYKSSHLTITSPYFWPNWTKHSKNYQLSWVICCLILLFVIMHSQCQVILFK